MVTNINELPGDIICYVLSLLTLRDAARARLVSANWRDLPDYRTALDFDTLNVLGLSSSVDGLLYQSKFVKFVDQFLEAWRGQKINVLKVKFGLGNAYGCHIDRWIASAIRTEVEDLTVNLSSLTYKDELYVFPCHFFIRLETELHLKHLCLERCRLPLSSACSDWLSNLTTLNLSHVPLHQTDMDCILSAAPSLNSLRLERCCFERIWYISIRSVNMKKLVIEEYLLGVELYCPNLKFFEYVGHARNLTFHDVCSLSEMRLWLYGQTGGCSLIFDDLTKRAPQLEVLCLLLRTEVQPIPVASGFTRYCLKKLDLDMLIPYGFDLVTITYMLNASPFLEELHLKLYMRTNTRKGIHKVHPECPHLRLKQVKITRFTRWQAMELTKYLLRNAVALKQMVIVSNDFTMREEHVALLKDINPMVDLAILKLR